MSAPTAPYVPDHDSWEGLVRLWEELDWPEGCKVEIIGGTVRVAPRVANRHALIDAHAPGGPTVTLYGEPKQDVYRVLRAGRFGDTFHLPTPFGVVLDTSAFPRP
ncbi:hypothetical protein ACWGAN_08235 [Streptomyces sp. NPDC054945]